MCLPCSSQELQGCLCLSVQWAFPVSQPVQKPRALILPLQLAVFKVLWLLLEVTLPLLLSVAILFTLSVQVRVQWADFWELWPAKEAWVLFWSLAHLLSPAFPSAEAGAGLAPRTAAPDHGHDRGRNRTRQEGDAAPGLAAPLLRKFCLVIFSSSLACFSSAGCNKPLNKLEKSSCRSDMLYVLTARLLLCSGGFLL